jgi:hypothetical protein
MAFSFLAGLGLVRTVPHNGDSRLRHAPKFYDQDCTPALTLVLTFMAFSFLVSWNLSQLKTFVPTGLDFSRASTSTVGAGLHVGLELHGVLLSFR